mmetsp:Transcript_29511/g.49606  ORF Transcript_29511/g.49606 Transcript_29511/m.49606 type:complete len:344 (+) Transcript_29511:64-1095(+)|eukprot:CAMPEP_0198210466 /NCGR_PEP_ID=MMETSP1445-20131203/20120_1 /TAXON_ID=36898 /ORGANISM="Pyramimonas sp., Strain CCMP2087" /LENGTH=343 /DNA_ID=CAMNT_0043884531 /DNA_START=44 /DNA_END=1075 /DNA_ORIENTATION=+
MGFVSEDVNLSLVTLASMWALYLLSSQTGWTQIKNMIFKLRLSVSVVLHLLFSRDKKWNKKLIQDPDCIANIEGTSKRVIFIRHGESDWNDIFNRGFGPMFPVRLIKGLLTELLSKFTTRDSIFVDSPLSPLGIRQANELRAFLKGKPMNNDPEAERAFRLLQGDSSVGSSVSVSSTLRRAIATGAVGLQDRVNRLDEKMLISSDLQEISGNPDTIALAQKGGCPDLDYLSKYIDGFSYDSFDPSSLNIGNKPVRGNGLTRLRRFANWMFTRNEETIIVNGHSLYFKHFFNTYLPASCSHPVRTKKISNCGVVSFSIKKAMYNNNVMFRIDPTSIQVVCGRIA